MAKADLVLYNATVVTMNARRDVFEPGAVAVEGNRLVGVGPQEAVLARFSAPETVDCEGRLLIPGLVNAHTHVPMSLLRGLVDDLRLDVWLTGYMMPVEREFVSPEFVRWGTLLGCAEMILSGVTTFADMYYFEDDVAEATAEAGMRAVLGQTLLKFPTPDAASYDEGLAYCRRFIERWRGHPLIVPAVAPHAPYTSTPEMIQQATALAAEMGVPIHIHLSETALEVRESRKQHGLPPIAYMNQLGLFQVPVIAAHCVHIQPSEMRLLGRVDAGVAHCPTSNLKLASGIAPVLEIRREGVPVGIGTDGCASNNDLDMFEEMRLAALLPKGVSGDPTALPAAEALAMATIEGARALHLDYLTGSLEVGKRADLITVQTDGPHATPQYRLSRQNVYSHLVYAAKSTDVQDVMVDGRWLMRNRRLLTVDLAEVQQRAKRFAEATGAFLHQREGSLLNKLLALGGLERAETYEIQVKARMQDPQAIEQRLSGPEFEIRKRSVRQQFDTYLLYNDPQLGMLRYREDNELVPRAEDERIPGQGLDVTPSYSLTLIGPTAEREYADSVILNRSRFTSKAGHSLRFYQEYFQPDRVVEIVKWRTRYRVLYGGEEFAINLDRLTKPAEAGLFLEIKSRTWSTNDALHKADLASRMLRTLGVTPEDIVRGEYIKLVNGK
ncbi:MAG: amidohydrolase family protein [Caldilineales bacterium]|nr:amidohydrolase family protein [Caldilineales bacterium]MDW8318204.1 amidohydrolase family protein [Anaerolineae bacterium]